MASHLVVSAFPSCSFVAFVVSVFRAPLGYPGLPILNPLIPFPTTGRGY